MALFGRKKQDSVLPDEVNQYYRSQKREKTGVVLVLGILALVATLLVGLAVFFGGRYLYNKVKGDDKTPTATVQTDNNKTDNTLEISEPEDGQSNVVDVDGTPATDSIDSDASTTESTDSVDSTPEQTPSLGDEEASRPTETTTILPATGDEGH